MTKIIKFKKSIGYAIDQPDCSTRARAHCDTQSISTKLIDFVKTDQLISLTGFWTSLIRPAFLSSILETVDQVRICTQLSILDKETAWISERCLKNFLNHLSLGSLLCKGVCPHSKWAGTWLHLPALAFCPLIPLPQYDPLPLLLPLQSLFAGRVYHEDVEKINVIRIR